MCNTKKNTLLINQGKEEKSKENMSKDSPHIPIPFTSRIH
jgi:hypothetical protein